jgi:hypothetical protein
LVFEKQPFNVARNRPPTSVARRAPNSGAVGRSG